MNSMIKLLNINLAYFVYQPDLMQVSNSMFEGHIDKAVLERFPAEMDKVFLSVQEPGSVSFVSHSSDVDLQT